jgi:hypothetical protein
VFHIRGIDAKQANMALTRLATTQDKARHGDEKSLATMKRLGITQRDVRQNGDDLKATLFDVADGLGRTEKGAKRTALAQQLFGRGAQTLLPLFNDGSKSLREQMGLAKEYGATLSGKSVDDIKKYIEAQHKWEYAQTGLQVSIGTVLLPLLTKGANAMSKLVLEFRNGTGTGGQIRDTVVAIGKGLIPTVKETAHLTAEVAHFLAKHPELAKVVGTVVALGLAVKAVRFAGSVSGVNHLISGVNRLRKTKAGEAAIKKIVDGFKGLPGRLKGPLGKAESTVTTEMATAGKKGGRTAASNTAAQTAANMGPELNKPSRKGKMIGSMKRLGRPLGFALGAAAVAAMALALDEGMSQIEDKLKSKGGKRGKAGQALDLFNTFVNPVTGPIRRGRWLGNKLGIHLPKTVVGGRTGAVTSPAAPTEGFVHHGAQPRRAPSVSTPGPLIAPRAAFGFAGGGPPRVVENHNTIVMPNGRVLAKEIHRVSVDEDNRR